MRDFVHQSLLSYFLGVLEITCSQDTTTDINAKYVKRPGSAQGCAFLGSQNQNLRLKPPFLESAILGPDFYYMAMCCEKGK